MKNQQVEAEGTLEQVDEAGFRRRYGTEWVLLDEREGEVAIEGARCSAPIRAPSTNAR